MYLNDVHRCWAYGELELTKRMGTTRYLKKQIHPNGNPPTVHKLGVNIHTQRLPI